MAGRRDSLARESGGTAMTICAQLVSTSVHMSCTQGSADMADMRSSDKQNVVSVRTDISSRTLDDDSGCESAERAALVDSDSALDLASAAGLA